METLSDIINAVSQCTGVPKWEILDGDSKKSIAGKKRVCHIIVNAYPFLIPSFASVSNINTATVFLYSNDMSCDIERDIDTRHIMNTIRQRLGLPTIKADKRRRKRKVISNTKRMFGFDYTDDEVMRRHNAIATANYFMTKYCSLGREPLEEGQVFTKPVHPDNSKRWHNQYKRN